MTAPTISPVLATALIVKKRQIDELAAAEAQFRLGGLPALASAANEEKKTAVRQFWSIVDANRLGGDWSAIMADARQIACAERGL